MFRPIGVLYRSTQLRHSRVKYKSIFQKASSSPSPSSSLKLPTIRWIVVVRENLSVNKRVCRKPGGGGTPYNGLHGEAPPERGTFFRLQVYKRVGISQVEVYKRVGKSVI